MMHHVTRLLLALAVTVLGGLGSAVESTLVAPPPAGDTADHLADDRGIAIAGPTITAPTAGTAGPAPTVAPPAVPVTAEERGAAALATISYPWQERLPGWEIRFLPATQGLYGLTLTGPEVIEVYVRDGQSQELLAHVIAHEIGHAVDVTLNDEPDRERWRSARGFTAPWWPDARASDFSTGAGDFAESFAAWQVGPASFRSDLGPAPSAEQVQLLAELSAG